jgi:hypothetical protein
MKGRIIVEYERDEKRETCNYKIKQEGNKKLSNEDIMSLFNHIISEMFDE